jgi:hypothetical protein
MYNPSDETIISNYEMERNLTKRLPGVNLLQPADRSTMSVLRSSGQAFILGTSGEEMG